MPTTEELVNLASGGPTINAIDLIDLARKTTGLSDQDRLENFEAEIPDLMADISEQAQVQQQILDSVLNNREFLHGVTVNRKPNGSLVINDDSGWRQEALLKEIGDRFYVNRKGAPGSAPLKEIVIPSGEEYALNLMRDIAKQRSELITPTAANESALSITQRGGIGFRPKEQGKYSAIEAYAGEGADIAPRYDKNGEQVGYWIRKKGEKQYKPVDPEGAKDIIGDIADVSGDVFRAGVGTLGTIVGGAVGARKGNPEAGALIGGTLGDVVAEGAAQAISGIAVPGEEDLTFGDRAKLFGFNVGAGRLADLAWPVLKTAGRAANEYLPGAAGRKALAETTKEGLGLAERTGVPLSVGQVTGSRTQGALESMVRQLPWSSGPMHTADVSRITNLGRHIDQTLTKVAGGEIDPAAASRLVGTSYDKWVRDVASKAGKDFGNAMTKATAEVGGERVIPMTNYVNALKTLRDEMGTFASGPKLGKAQQEIDALIKSSENNVDRAGNIAATPREFQNALHSLRMQAELNGGLFEWLDGRAGRRHTKALLGALHSDLDSAVEQGGRLGQAAKGIRDAHDAYKKAFETIDESRTVLLEELAGRVGGKEAIGKDLSTMAKDVMRGTPMQIADTFAVANRIDPVGAASMRGSALQSFFEQASTKGQISPAKISTSFEKNKAKIAALLSGDKEAFDMMSDIANVAKRIGDRPGANPSGTAPMLTLIGSIWGMHQFPEVTANLLGGMAATRVFAHAVNSKPARAILKQLLHPSGIGVGPMKTQQFVKLVTQLAELVNREEVLGNE